MIQCPAPSLVDSAPLPISTKERFKCLDYDNIKEQPVVEDERPDDASSLTPISHLSLQLQSQSGVTM